MATLLSVPVVCGVRLSVQVRRKVLGYVRLALPFKSPFFAVFSLCKIADFKI